jgi:hypothetical protein
MSVEITTAFRQEYKSGIEMLVQQMSSKMRGAVREEAISAKRAFFDQIGAVAATEATERHGDTQYVDTPHRRRSVSAKTYRVADLVDVPDLIRTLNDPTNAYSQAFAAALNRGIDREIATAAIGTAYTGETGNVAIALPSAQKIVAGGTGFTLAKLRSAMKKFKSANAIMPGDELYVAWTSAQEDEFIDTTEVKSVDYNAQRVLVSGGIDGFYGFKFIRLEDAADGVLLSKSGTTRSCLAWCRSGLLLGLGQDIDARIDPLPSKNYAVQVYASMDIGATRMQEEKVIQIDCVES